MTLSKADKTPGEAYDQFMQDNKSKPMEIRKVPGAGTHIDQNPADLVGKKRQVMLDMLGAILFAKESDASPDLWKIHIDAALDKLDQLNPQKPGEEEV